MTANSRHNLETGQRAEQLACAHLESAGLVLIDRNYRCARGELDLIMQHRATLVFVEVRYRRQTRYGSGAESVGPRKRARLIATAEHYLQRNPRRAAQPARFDVVAIRLQDGGPDFDWIQDAFRVD